MWQFDGSVIDLGDILDGVNAASEPELPPPPEPAQAPDAPTPEIPSPAPPVEPLPEPRAATVMMEPIDG